MRIRSPISDPAREPGVELYIPSLIYHSHPSLIYHSHPAAASVTLVFSEGSPEPARRFCGRLLSEQRAGSGWRSLRITHTPASATDPPPPPRTPHSAGRHSAGSQPFSFRSAPATSGLVATDDVPAFGFCSRQHPGGAVLA